MTASGFLTCARHRLADWWVAAEDYLILALWIYRIARRIPEPPDPHDHEGCAVPEGTPWIVNYGMEDFQ